MSREPDLPSSDDPVVELLRLAGRRPEAPPKLAAEVRAVVHAHYREPALRGQSWRRALRWAWAPSLVALAVAVVTPLLRGVGPESAGNAVLARVAALDGEVFRVEPDGALRRVALGEDLRPGERIETGSGRVALARASGGTVRVDAGSDFEWRSAARLQLAHGAVYVDSGSGASGPDSSLQVETALGSVRDIGTRFEVRTLGAGLRVRVREGRVELSPLGGPGEVAGWSPSPLAATAGEELVWLPARGASRTAVPLTGEPWAWTQSVVPPFDLGGRRLEEILGWASAETGRRVEWANDELRATYGGELLEGAMASDRPEEAIARVLPAFGLSYRLVGDAWIVVAP